MVLFSIYTLRNPNNDEIFYVGFTSHAKTRKNTHRSIAKKLLRGDYCDTMITKRDAYIIAHHIYPVFEILDVIRTFDKDEAYDLETYWIHQFKAWGFNLTNSVNSNSKRSDSLKYKVAVLNMIKNNKAA